METFVKGDLVVVPFPFSDLSKTRRRPALVVAAYGGPDVILAQITSQPAADSYAIDLTDDDIATGTLQRRSYIRPNKLFTCAQDFILYKIGHLESSKITEVTESLLQLFTE